MPAGYTKVSDSNKPKLDRATYYEQYITNLLPSNFILKRVGSNIIISVPSK